MVSKIDGVLSQVEPTIVRFNLSRDYLRGVAKVAFHYFLWACPQIGGDEPEFTAIKAFIRDGVGEPADHMYRSESLVARPPNESGKGPDCHMFAAFCLGPDLVAQVHFFSQPVGPSLPTFVVILGRRPESLTPAWQRAHIAAYQSGVDGHDGALRELRANA